MTLRANNLPLRNLLRRPGRTAALVRRVGDEGEYMMTGGVARNRGVVEVLEKKLGQPIHVSEHAQLCGAIGAALLAREKR